MPTTSAERTARWRERNRELSRERQRVYSKRHYLKAQKRKAERIIVSIKAARE